MENELLKPKEAAKLLNVTTQSLRNWSNEGRIKVIKTPGGHSRILKSEIDKLLKDIENEQM